MKLIKFVMLDSRISFETAQKGSTPGETNLDRSLRYNCYDFQKQKQTQVTEYPVHLVRHSQSEKKVRFEVASVHILWAAFCTVHSFFHYRSRTGLHLVL